MMVEKEQQGATPSQTTTKGPVRFRVADLLQGAREAILELDGKDYRLRVTANGKLILTK